MASGKFTACALLAGIAICLPGASFAQATPIGYVKTATGKSSVTTAGQRVKAGPGTPIQMGSLLKTEANSSLGVTFRDNTVMSFGPDTEVTVDEYLYEPAQGKLGLVASLSKGTMDYLSGVIAHLKPDSVSVKTPTGIIGVRGTQFAAKVQVPQ